VASRIAVGGPTPLTARLGGLYLYRTTDWLMRGEGVDLRRTTARKRLAVGVAGCLVIAAVAGCGGGGSSSSSTSGGSSTGGGESSGGGAKAASGTPVKIGMIAPEGTPAFNLPNEIAAVNAGIDAINNSGGLEGHPLQLVYCNDKGEPNQTTSCGREMVSENVIAVVGGGALSGNVLPPILAEGESATIGSNPLTGPELNAPGYFLFTGGSSVAYSVLAAYQGKAGLPTSMFTVDNSTGQALLTAIEESAKASGSPFVQVVPVAADQSDFAPVVVAGKPDEAEGALLFLGTEQGAQLIQAAQSAGTEFTYMYSGEPDQTLTEAFGGTVKKMIYTTPFPPLSSSNPAIEKFKEDMELGVEEGVSHAEDALEYAGYTTIEGWLALQVIQQLLEEGKIKELTASGVMSALKGVKGLNIGLLKSWSPNEEGPEGLSRASNLAYNIVAINEGNEEQVTKEPVTAEEIISGEVKVEDPLK
jgi:ABC-type branched-subunit amino acid transport system substrate-binding protein